MRFNILTDNSIRVSDLKGHKYDTSILDALNNAHNIKELALRDYCKLPYEEAVVFKLICAFVQASYQPTNVSDIADIFEAGHFDMEKIDAYVKKCEKRGNVFDLFDEKYPFLQCTNIDLDDATKTVGVLSTAYKTGNSLLFYGDNTYLEKNRNIEMTFQQYFAALCRNQYASVASGLGYTSSGICGGEPPILCITNGKNLFESICFSMGYMSKHLYDVAKPIWERDTYHYDFIKASKNDCFDYLSSFFSPVKYIRYGETTDKAVKSVYIKGMSGFYKNEYKASPSEEAYHMLFIKSDPNVIGREKTVSNQNSKAYYVERLRKNTIAWYMIGASNAKVMEDRSVLGLSSGYIINELVKEDLLKPETPITCQLYGMVEKKTGENANLSMYAEGTVTAAVYDSSKQSVVQELIENIDTKAKCLFSITRDIYEKDVDISDMCGLASQVKRKYIDRMQDYYFSSFIPKITNSKEEDLKNLKDELNEIITREAVEAFNIIPARGRQLIEKESSKYKLYNKKGSSHGN